MQPTCIPEPVRVPDHIGHGKTDRLQITLVSGNALTPRHQSIWRELQSGNSELANPCFSPEFTQAVAAVRADVEVAFIKQGREVVAVFPFQRRGTSKSIPVGGIVSDYQGLICQPDFTCDPRDILKGCNLVAWDFDRLLASQRCFASYHKLCEPSAVIDLSDGFKAYVTERETAGTRQIDQCYYMIRRLEREVGPVKFVPHSCDPAHLQQVLHWKSQQYRRSRWPDLFATNWGPGLLERIQAIQKPQFAGMLSVLYAGNRFIAGHIGMRSTTVWHYWFPAYDRQFARYSPGLILLLNMIQHAERLGLQTIDLGTGTSLYKQRLMNASVSVAEGSVERPSCLLLVRSVRRRLSSFLRTQRLKK